MAIEIVEFPIKHGDFPQRTVKLPEGKSTRHLFGTNQCVAQTSVRLT